MLYIATEFYYLLEAKAPEAIFDITTILCEI